MLLQTNIILTILPLFLLNFKEPLPWGQYINQIAIALHLSGITQQAYNASVWHMAIGNRPAYTQGDSSNQSC